MNRENLYKEQLFTEVFHASKDKLYAFLREYTDDTHFAEDIMQVCYIKVWENIDRWNNADRLLPLIKTIARNLLLNAIRNKAQLPVEWLEKHGVDLRQCYQPDHDQVKRSLSSLDTVINQLPDRCRKVFLLHRESGLSYDEIAARLSISVHTVRNHMSKAIQLLKTHLQKS
ncbi:RNA polymerase sigma factor [Longitalea arenae]|uniref:RNA polymerase sigma factor n=1 Tax=Longitalea arenae TaxID=2812558 RepID=UPI001966D1C6|nr:sigma-70 family RNA polymerase sigma factor [Longitalea arenae]